MKSCLAAGYPFVFGFIGDSSSLPVEITPGPDGALWFTVPDHDLIGRITPDARIPSARSLWRAR